MLHDSYWRRCAPGLSILSCLALLAVSTAHAQTTGNDAMVVNVSTDTQRLEMTVKTSRILTMPSDIPKVQVNDPDIASVQPLAANKIQLTAKKPGVTQVNIWNKQDHVQSIDVFVFADARELKELLRTQFPTSSLQVVPMANAVILSGYVEQPEQVSRVIRMAEEFYPKVINNITVGGVEQVLLHVKVMEVSRTKLRTLGVDFAGTTGGDFLVSSISGLISAADASVGLPVGAGDTLRFGIVNGNTRFFAFIEALRRDNLMKILAEPTLVTVSGRPAEFKVGGQIPIIVPQSLGTVSIEYKDYGTQVDFVPIVQGNGWIRLEVRPRVSELDYAQGVVINNVTVPGLRLREVDTGVNMRAGQTLALAGLVQNRTEATNTGLPYLADLPYLGVPFRRVTETNNEIELLIMVTPELVSAMDRHEVPPCGPGMGTTSPRDCDLYWKGHLEVPSPGPCGQGNCDCHHGPRPIGMEEGQGEEVSPAPQGNTAPPAPPTPGPQARRTSPPMRTALVSQPARNVPTPVESMRRQPVAAEPTPAAPEVRQQPVVRQQQVVRQQPVEMPAPQRTPSPAPVLVSQQAAAAPVPTAPAVRQQPVVARPAPVPTLVGQEAAALPLPADRLVRQQRAPRPIEARPLVSQQAAASPTSAVAPVSAPLTTRRLPAEMPERLENPIRRVGATTPQASPVNVLRQPSQSRSEAAQPAPEAGAIPSFIGPQGYDVH